DLIADGRLGDLLELRGRGKEDQRGGGQDLMVLGTHLFDLMRLLAGDPHWCFARILQNGKPATKADVREGGENMGPVLGDSIHATYGFDKGVIGTFGTHKAKAGANTRYGLWLYGTKGVVYTGTGSLPKAYFLDDPSWTGEGGKKGWQEVTSAGLGKPEPLA